MAESRKLRILCIHGYRQNAQMFREKTGSMRKILKKYADFVFITAPHKVPPGNMGSAALANPPAEGAGGETTEGTNENGAVKRDADERGWWFSREDNYFKSTDYSSVSKGFDESLKLITDTLEDPNEGNFDGVLAFSQGASLLSILCLMQEKEKKNWFKFAVLVSGFKSPSSNHDVHYVGKVAIPSLHTFGDTDEVIAWERSEALSSFFENPKFLKHTGGHFIPASSAYKKTWLEFFEEMWKHCGL